MTIRPKQPHSACLWRHHLEPLWGFPGVLVGQAGSFILIPLRVYVLRVPTRFAIGSNLRIILFAALAGLGGTWRGSGSAISGSGVGRRRGPSDSGSRVGQPTAETKAIAFSAGRSGDICRSCYLGGYIRVMGRMLGSRSKNAIRGLTQISPRIGRSVTEFDNVEAWS